MITVELAEKFHARSIEEFGGAEGLRALGDLKAALARPFRHPWLDGNKRTGLGLALFLLLRAGIHLQASQDELYELTIRVAEGKSSVVKIQEWIEARRV